MTRATAPKLAVLASCCVVAVGTVLVQPQSDSVSQEAAVTLGEDQTYTVVCPASHAAAAQASQATDLLTDANAGGSKISAGSVLTVGPNAAPAAAAQLLPLTAEPDDGSGAADDQGSAGQGSNSQGASNGGSGSTASPEAVVPATEVAGDAVISLNRRPAAETSNAPMAVRIGGPDQPSVDETGAAGTTTDQTNADQDAGGEVTIDPALIAGLSWSSASSGPGQGTMVSGCFQPAAQSWLVGGATTADHATTVVLANPFPAAVSARLTTYTAEGADQPAGAQNLVIAPHSTRRVLLGGLIPERDAVAVQVETSDGPIVSYLEDSVTDGVAPAGVDIVAPQTIGQTRIVIPGTHLGENRSGAVRLVNPNPEDVVVSWVALAEGQQPSVLTDMMTTIPARTAQEVPLPDDYPPGVGALILEAEQPLFAGIGQDNVTGKQTADLAENELIDLTAPERITSDVAWVVPAPALPKTSQLAATIPLPSQVDGANVTEELIVASPLAAGDSGSDEVSGDGTATGDTTTDPAVGESATSESADTASNGTDQEATGQDAAGQAASVKVQIVAADGSEGQVHDHSVAPGQVEVIDLAQLIRGTPNAAWARVWDDTGVAHASLSVANSAGGSVVPVESIAASANTWAVWWGVDRGALQPAPAASGSPAGRPTTSGDGTGS